MPLKLAPFHSGHEKSIAAPVGERIVALDSGLAARLDAHVKQISPGEHVARFFRFDCAIDLLGELLRQRMIPFGACVEHQWKRLLEGESLDSAKYRHHVEYLLSVERLIRRGIEKGTGIL